MAQKKKAQQVKREWFVVISEDGYFSGLAFGGELQWSMHERDAKPLDHMNKFKTLQSLCSGRELIVDLIHE